MTDLHTKKFLVDACLGRKVAVNNTTLVHYHLHHMACPRHKV
jgi:hypothetical protein